MTNMAGKAGVSIRWWTGAGLIAFAGFLAIVVGWGVFARLDSAVVADGKIVLEGDVKTVQARDGGVIAALHVTDGDAVKAGDLLIALDDTIQRANLEAIETQMVQLVARIARLKAQVADRETIEFPESLIARMDDPLVAESVEGEEAVHAATRRLRSTEREQIARQIDQLGDEIQGYDIEREAAESERSIIEQEFAAFDRLRSQELILASQVNENRRLSASLLGRIGAATAKAANGRGRIAELRLAMAEVDEAARAQALIDLREAERERAQLRERALLAADALLQTEIRAPQAGVVHDLAVHAVRGVVGSGEPLMQIVPGDAVMLVEAKILPVDIDRIARGQDARVRFTAFSQRIAPELDAEVVLVGADLTEDERAGTAYYISRLAVDLGSAELPGDLVPGMPAQVFVETGERSPLDMLMRPILDQMRVALREE